MRTCHWFGIGRNRIISGEIFCAYRTSFFTFQILNIPLLPERIKVNEHVYYKFCICNEAMMRYRTHIFKLKKSPSFCSALGCISSIKPMNRIRDDF